jgi:hypothetical protein
MSLKALAEMEVIENDDEVESLLLRDGTNGERAARHEGRHAMKPSSSKTASVGGAQDSLPRRKKTYSIIFGFLTGVVGLALLHNMSRGGVGSADMEAVQTQQRQKRTIPLPSTSTPTLAPKEVPPTMPVLENGGHHNITDDATAAATAVTSATTTITRPCNVIGVSNFHHRPTTSLTNLHQQKDSNNPSAIIKVFIKGRFGNHLFQHAAFVAEGIETGLPLQHKPNTFWPRLTEIMVDKSQEEETEARLFLFPIIKYKRSLVQTVQPGPPFYQTAYWANKFAQHRSELCYYLAMMPLLKQQQLPNVNDIVIHFRDFDTSRRRRRRRRRRSRRLSSSSAQHFLFDVFEGETRITIPPTIYYDRILETGNYDTIWLVAEPAARRHPIVQHVLTKFPHNAVMREGGTSEEDFQFISFASHVVLSPSTFGWWAGFFAAGGDGPTTVHYPLMPVPVPMPWCDLVGGFRGSAATMVFHDWYNNITVINDPDEALHICKMYEVCPPPLQSVAAYYPELDVTTTTTTNGGRRPWQHRWWQWSGRHDGRSCSERTNTDWP